MFGYSIPFVIYFYFICAVLFTEEYILKILSCDNNHIYVTLCGDTKLWQLKLCNLIGKQIDSFFFNLFFPILFSSTIHMQIKKILKNSQQT